MNRLVLLLVFLVGLTACATAQRGALMRARSAIEKGKFTSALHRLSDAESYKEANPEMKAEMIYLKGVCYQGLRQEAEAKAIFGLVVRQYSETQYAALAEAKLSQMQTASPQ